MSKKYNVLWIDDEHESMTALHKTATDFDITLHPFKSMNGGCAEFERNYTKYDAVLFDAKFFENESDHRGSEDTKWVHQAKDKIRDVDRSIEFFVLTGQAEAYNSKEFKNAFPHVFNKGVGEDEDKLFEMLVKACKNRELTTLKYEHKQLFEVLQEYPDSVRDIFISIFMGLKGIDNKFDDQLYFTQLRIILETMFRKANDIGLLHDKCVQRNGSQVNLTESQLFLSGYDTKHLNVKCSVTHFPKVIANNVKNLIYTTGAASHTSKVDVTQNIDIQTYRKDINTPYLLYSLALQLMDVLIWFKTYSKQNNNIATNKSYWQNIQVQGSESIYEGVVNKDAQGNYHCGEYLLNKGYVERNEHNGKKIRIIESSENGNPRLNRYYPYYADRYQKIS